MMLSIIIMSARWHKEQIIPMQDYNNTMFLLFYTPYSKGFSKIDDDWMDNKLLCTNSRQSSKICVDSPWGISPKLGIVVERAGRASIRVRALEARARGGALHQHGPHRHAHPSAASPAALATISPRTQQTLYSTSIPQRHPPKRRTMLYCYRPGVPVSRWRTTTHSNMESPYVIFVH